MSRRREAQDLERVLALSMAEQAGGPLGGAEPTAAAPAETADVAVDQSDAAVGLSGAALSSGVAAEQGPAWTDGERRGTCATAVPEPGTEPALHTASGAKDTAALTHHHTSAAHDAVAGETLPIHHEAPTTSTAAETSNGAAMEAGARPAKRGRGRPAKRSVAPPNTTLPPAPDESEGTTPSHAQAGQTTTAAESVPPTEAAPTEMRVEIPVQAPAPVPSTRSAQPSTDVSTTSEPARAQEEATPSSVPLQAARRRLFGKRTCVCTDASPLVFAASDSGESGRKHIASPRSAARDEAATSAYESTRATTEAAAPPHETSTSNTSLRLRR